jgi:phage I-like protein
MKVDMSNRLFYTVDLMKEGSISFAEGQGFTTWIQGLPLGTYEHIVYGTIKVTPEKVANMVRNFYDKVRGTDLDIDYEHKEFTSKAAGWIVDVQDRAEQGLWLLVEWTPSAYQALREQEYRYFSPEFADQWSNPKTGQSYTDVLFGGGITNRPFLKDIAPINLSELGLPNKEGDESVELAEQLATLLGVQLSDQSDASEIIIAAIKKLQEPAPSSDEDKLKKLSETDPVVARLLADRDQDRTRLAALEEARNLSEVTRQLSETRTDKATLPPAIAEQLVKPLSDLGLNKAQPIIKALHDLVKTGLVQLTEIGTQNPATNAGDAIKSFNDSVDKVIAERKLSYKDAVLVITQEQPELWAAYNDSRLAEVK